jgi:osmotically-inducible protein OsmY
MKRLVPFAIILTFTSTLTLTACDRFGITKTEETTPTFRVGLQGEYDQSGLAKRVAAAFEQDPELAQISTIYVAQTGSTVVLRGTVSDQATLDKLVSVAQAVEGATRVDTSQVQVKKPS